MNDEDARKVARALLTELGLDVDEPHEMQADFVFLRKQRTGSEALGRYAKFAVIGILISGAFTALWWGLQVAFNQPPTLPPHP